MDHQIESHHYRPDIQGLRAVAVLLVVFYHAGFNFLPGGYIGVDIFFVISGYLITNLLLRELTISNTINITNFYARRIRRLLPAVTVVTIATLAAAWIIYSPLELIQFISSAFATIFYVSNIWFAHISVDYLAEGVNVDPLLHTWSLSAEEQFYLIWPFLLLLLARKKPAQLLRWRLTNGMSVVIFISLLSAIFLTYYNQPRAFFISPTRAWEFGLGGLVVLWAPTKYFSNNKLILMAETIGLILILSASLLFNNRTHFPGVAAIFPVLGACLIIGSSHNMRPSFVNRQLGIKPLRFIGNISYSLYLWHWPVFIFMGLLIPDMGSKESIAGILLSLFFGWITYVLVENPFRFSKPLSSRAYKSIALGLLLTASSASLALLVEEVARANLKSEVQQRYLAASHDIPKIYSGDPVCHLRFFQVNIPECNFGDISSQSTIVLFGDSHAAQWFPALEKIAETKGLRLVSLTKTSCPSVVFEPYEAQLERPYTECGQWRERAFEKIKNLKPIITIIANSNKYIDVNDPNQVSIWRNGLKSTLQTLSEFSHFVVIIRDTPWLNFIAPKCLSRAYWQGNNPSLQCVLKQNVDNQDIIFEIESAEVSKLDQGIMIDMTKAICPNMPCLIERDGFILYHDSHHLTASFSRHIADRLIEQIQLALPNFKRK